MILRIGIKSKIKIFADDTSLFSTVTDPTLTDSELNYDLKLIEQWAYLWKMSFNPDPNKQVIKVLLSHKISIARKGIGIIKYMLSYAPTKPLDQIYKIFVRPHMDYCDIIYHLPRITSAFDCPINLNFMIQSLESTQYQAALAVSGAWKGSSTTKLYEELWWESLI